MALTREKRYRLKHPDRARAIRAKWRGKNLVAWADYFLKWRRKDPPHAIAIHLWHGAKKRSEKAKLPFELDVKEIERRVRLGICEMTGLTFDLSAGVGRKAWAPSIDRIDPCYGYVEGNWRVVVYMYNVAKNRWTDADVFRLATAIVEKGAPIDVGQQCVYRVNEHRTSGSVNESLSFVFDADNRGAVQLGDVDA